MVENLIYIVAAYLIGSVPFGYLAGRMNGLDLREHGSRNIGATNAVRVLGKKWGIPVFVCDFLKGYLPLLFMAQHLGGDVTTFDAAQMGWFLGVLFALVLGHTFTCYLNFKGGKGVATTGGCLFAVSPIVGWASVATWIVCMLFTRYVSLSSMAAGLAMMSAAVYVFCWQDGTLSAADGMVLGLLGFIFVLVVWKHRSNIVRLCNGTEPKAFSKK
ncbi:MAG: glycerol-3-phosphate 1-O-acyltransferase PlsY [Akkermansia sp.]|jgi:glycerol-3-phosphate acyltransferase PlsY|nr:glycerol-3-phosphate 1-O-acyltransferase PlsY [Akkermansia sp.]